MARRDFGSQLASFGKSRAVINEATCEMKEADVPLMSQWTCETQPEECNHCLAFLIHLGCDIRHEIEDIQGKDGQDKGDIFSTLAYPSNHRQYHRTGRSAG